MKRCHTRKKKRQPLRGSRGRRAITNSRTSPPPWWRTGAASPKATSRKNIYMSPLGVGPAKYSLASLPGFLKSTRALPPIYWAQGALRPKRGLYLIGHGLGVPRGHPPCGHANHRTSRAVCQSGNQPDNGAPQDGLGGRLSPNIRQVAMAPSPHVHAS